MRGSPSSSRVHRRAAGSMAGRASTPADRRAVEEALKKVRKSERTSPPGQHRDANLASSSNRGLRKPGVRETLEIAVK
jgi:hypothetical protein